MNENEIAKIIVDTAYKIHTRLGPDLLASAYQAIMVYELQNRGLQVEAEISIPIHYNGINLNTGQSRYRCREVSAGQRNCQWTDGASHR